MFLEPASIDFPDVSILMCKRISEIFPSTSWSLALSFLTSFSPMPTHMTGQCFGPAPVECKRGYHREARLLACPRFPTDGVRCQGLRRYRAYAIGEFGSLYLHV